MTSCKVVSYGTGDVYKRQNLFCGENHLSPLRGNEIIFAIPCDGESVLENLSDECYRCRIGTSCFLWRIRRHGFSGSNVHPEIFLESGHPVRVRPLCRDVYKRQQLHIAETEKYAHVTFFFNGGRETPYDAEERILVPSP